MNKLLKLKEWLTPEQAAAYISQSLSEVVTVADVLKLAIDGNIVLSIYLPNGILIQRYEDVALEDISFNPLRSPNDWEAGEDHQGRGVFCFRGKYLRIADFVGDGMCYLENGAVADLAMIGTELAEVEGEFHRHFGVPELVNRGAGFAHLVHHGELGIARGCIARVDSNDSAVPAALRERGVTAVEIEKLREVGMFVFRTSSLVEFLADLDERNRRIGIAAGGPATRQRRTLLTIIAALCRRAGIDPAARGAAGQIAAATAEIGAAVGDDSIREVLKQLQDAVESRAN